MGLFPSIYGKRFYKVKSRKIILKSIFDENYPFVKQTDLE
jgi:hypothetical protein